MRFLKFFALLVLLAGTFVGGYVFRAVRHASAAAPGRRVLYYVDPMHPAYKSDKPGIAPDCGMQLEPVYADEAVSSSAPRPKVLYYRDPARPDYKADTPGVNPETGHTLEPVYDTASQLTPRPGTIRISPERQQVIGVKFATVDTTSTVRTIRTVGKVTPDETRIGHVHTRIDGWADKLFVDFTGDLVKKGQPMLTLYSPEMLASQQELLLAARARDEMKDNPMASASAHGESLFEAARRRLELWELSDRQIDEVLRTGKPIRSITVYAPMTGYVTARNVFPDQKVTPETDLYVITDLGRVWIMADVFESDITAIKAGDAARVTFSSPGTPPLVAKVDYIQPQVDPMTRTLQVRLDAPNPGLRMKPDMFVNVEFGVDAAPQLTVPASAVLDTGDRQTVFVDLGGGYLEPRQVTVGGRFEDRLAITHGLSAGERVVASGTFLIDSESQLKAAENAMGGPGQSPATAGATASAAPASGGRRD